MPTADRAETRDTSIRQTTERQSTPAGPTSQEQPHGILDTNEQNSGNSNGQATPDLAPQNPDTARGIEHVGPPRHEGAKPEAQTSFLSQESLSSLPP